MSPQITFVAGASRGIGLEMVRQLARDTEVRVIAAARNPSAAEELQKIVAKSEGRVETVTLDVGSEESIAAAVKATREISFVKDNASSIDILQLVAGVASSGKANALEQTAETLRKEMDANYIGAILTTIALVPLLQSSPKKAPARIMIMSSMLGSAGLLTELGSWKAASSGYSASKAAISMWARKLAYDLASDGSIGFPREEGWAVGLIHPGSVLTDMNPNGDITVVESAAGVIDVTRDQLTADTSGGFWDWKGQTIPF